MRWARDGGRLCYDFDGIDVAALEGPDSKRTVAHFKMGFGGQVVHRPPTVVRLENTVLRIGYGAITGPLRGLAKRAGRRLQVGT